MANTYSLIASTSLTGTQATVTFSSIPATYNDLSLVMSVRDTDATTFNPVNIVFNSDTTNYSFTYLRGNGSAAASFKQASPYSYFNAYYNNGGNATTSTFGSLEVYIPSYTVSANKPVSIFGAQENNNATAYIATTATLFSSTATISSIQLTPNGGSFASGSTFWLYGIKNS